MCTVLLAWRCVAGAEIVLAANRDEFFGRQSSDPMVLRDRPRIVGGRDMVAGGTWMGVAADGRIALVTNRLTRDYDKARRSRGDLPLDVLATGDDATARTLMEGLDSLAYNAFNLLYVSGDTALVGHGGRNGPIRVVELSPGPHVLTLYDVNQADNAKVDFLSHELRLAIDGAADPTTLLGSMEEILRDHGREGRNGLEQGCVHAESYGTVSSSSVLVMTDGELIFRHASGPPCDTAYRDLSALLR